MEKIKYLGHASLKITAGEKTIYADPFAGTDYTAPADLVLETHAHFDHTKIELVTKAPDCTVFKWSDALAGGGHAGLELPWVRVESVEAGNNPNHDVRECVGFVLTFPDGVRIYISGDTSKVPQMAELRDIDYAFFCCDGVFNMGPAEASECAALVGAKHSIPYHTDNASVSPFSHRNAEQFQADGRIILKPGDILELIK